MVTALRIPALIIVVAALLLACSVRQDNDDFAGLVDIGGREVYLECHGEGSPTVILVSGFRNNAMVWSADPYETGATMVLPAVAEETRICAWDRPGTVGFAPDALSRSDPVPMPRTPEEVAVELHAVLEAAGEDGPYVLAAHSFGGVFARVYAATYPNEVDGLVLIDVWPEQIKAILSPAEYERYNELVVAIPPSLEGYAELEFVEPGVVSDQLLTSPPALQPMPLYVLARAQPLDLGPQPGFDDLTGTVEQAWRAGQDVMATLTPGARYEIAVESSHYIYAQQPELVIEAIERVVEAVRDPDGW